MLSEMRRVQRGVARNALLHVPFGFPHSASGFVVVEQSSDALLARGTEDRAVDAAISMKSHHEDGLIPIAQLRDDERHSLVRSFPQHASRPAAAAGDHRKDNGTLET